MLLPDFAKNQAFFRSLFNPWGMFFFLRFHTYSEFLYRS